ncbi:MAG TPA: TauD/TfdA family dioxygenase [Polyangiaceae bacterium]|jgi:taurine dioxygenase|nr:TauD/TfdA family dioxygenase [Polyangiaceae bacterium]
MSEPASYQHIEVRPVAGYIGAEIGKVDLARPLSDAAAKEIRSALLKYKVIFFRGQEQVGHEEQIAFARHFGEVTYAHPHEDEPFAEFPEILPIDTKLYEQRYGRKLASYESRWHTDVTAAVNPPAASILRAVKVPSVGGDTTWTNLVAAYENLSAPLRALADQLRAEHRFGLHLNEGDKYLARIRENPLVAVHPVVRVHPETGERALFVSPGFTSHIVGVPRHESKYLLELFFEQIARPAFTVRFRWEPGDIAFWDNRATAHLAPQDILHLDADRVLYRVTLTGDVPVGVDGVRSTLVQGKPFATEAHPRARQRPTPKEQLIKEQLLV